MTQSINEGLQKLYRAELKASHIYLHFALRCNETGYVGAEEWFKQQSQEEREHAIDVANYILSKGGNITTPALPEMNEDYQSILQILEATLAEEEMVAQEWSEFRDVCTREKDYMALQLADKYLCEQNEEIDKVSMLIARLRMMMNESGDNGYAWGRIDEIMCTESIY